jgi:uncharacterized protein (TIGR00661 family)
MASSAGLLCSAGFEGPSEALFLGKKLFAVTIKGQYEQYCNASSLKQLGLPNASEINDDSLMKLRDWGRNEQNIKLDFPNQTPEILKAEIFAPDKFRLLTE